jgi:hypothetical protein
MWRAAPGAAPGGARRGPPAGGAAAASAHPRRVRAGPAAPHEPPHPWVATGSAYRRRQRRAAASAAAPDGGAAARLPPPPAAAPPLPSAAAAAAAEEKLAAFEAALGGVPRAALLQLLERAPPQVCAFSAETLELTLASLEAALGYDRATVSQLVRLAPGVLVAPHEPAAALHLLSAMLRLPPRSVAANVRTRLGLLALGEARLRARCAALARLLQCDGARAAGGGGFSTAAAVEEPDGGGGASSGGGGGGGGWQAAVRPSSGAAPWREGGGGGTSRGGGSGGDEAGDEAAFAAFAARSPGQALAVISHPASAVAERMAAAAAALGGPPAGALAALARARPLVLELSPVVLRSRVQVLADVALLPGSLADRVGGAAHAAAAARDAGDGPAGAAAAGRVAGLLGLLDAEELEGLADRLLLAPHSLHLWLQQLASLLPGRPPSELVRLLLRLRARPPDVLVRWQALHAAARGHGGWGSQLEGAAVEDLARLLSCGHEQLARLRYLSATGRRDEASLVEVLELGAAGFDARFPGFLEWIRCGG